MSLLPQEMRVFSGWPETGSLGGQCPHRGGASRGAGTAASEERRLGGLAEPPELGQLLPDFTSLQQPGFKSCLFSEL